MLCLPPLDQLHQDGQLSHQSESLLSGEPLFVEQRQHIPDELPLNLGEAREFRYRVLGQWCLWMCMAQLRESAEDLLLLESLLIPDGFDQPRLFLHPSRSEAFDGGKRVEVEWGRHSRQWLGQQWKGVKNGAR